MSTLKFGVDVKEFDDLFKKGNNDFQVLVDNAIMPRYNTMAWRNHFVKADMPTPVDERGVGSFTQIQVTTRPAVMLLPRASWTPPAESNGEGFDYYQGSLADYGYSNVITAQQRDYYAKMLAKLNGNETVLGSYIRSTNDLVNGANATLTNLS